MSRPCFDLRLDSRRTAGSRTSSKSSIVPSVGAESVRLPPEPHILFYCGSTSSLTSITFVLWYWRQDSRVRVPWRSDRCQALPLHPVPTSARRTFPVGGALPQDIGATRQALRPALPRLFQYPRGTQRAQRTLQDQLSKLPKPDGVSQTFSCNTFTQLYRLSRWKGGTDIGHNLGTFAICAEMRDATW